MPQDLLLQESVEEDVVVPLDVLLLANDNKTTGNAMRDEHMESKGEEQQGASPFVGDLCVFTTSAYSQQQGPNFGTIIPQLCANAVFDFHSSDFLSPAAQGSGAQGSDGLDVQLPPPQPSAQRRGRGRPKSTINKEDPEVTYLKRHVKRRPVFVAAGYP